MVCCVSVANRKEDTKPPYRFSNPVMHVSSYLQQQLMLGTAEFSSTAQHSTTQHSTAQLPSEIYKYEPLKIQVCYMGLPQHCRW